MTRIMILDHRGRFRFRLQTRRWGIWRTTYTSDSFASLTLLLAALSHLYVRATEDKTGHKFTRQQRRAAGRAIAKVAH